MLPFAGSPSHLGLGTTRAQDRSAAQAGLFRPPSSPPSPAMAPTTPKEPTLLAKLKMHQIAMRMVKVAEMQRRRHRKSIEDHEAAVHLDEEHIAAATGVRLDNVLAFRKLVNATMNATVASASLREKDSVLGKTTLAMSIFNIPSEIQRRVTDKDRWRRLFPAARGERPGGVLTALFLAIMAEACGRYDEADVYILQLLVCKAARLEELTPEERTCVQRAFHRRIQQSKNSWKHVMALEKALDIRRDASNSKRSYKIAELAACKDRLRDDIVRHCYGIIWATTHLIMPTPGSPATQMFSHKCIATAFRQVTQFTDSVPQYQCLQLAEANYKRAVHFAKTDETMGPCDKLRIETLISWANFLFYNLEKKDEALASARETLQESMTKLDSVPQAQFADVVEALQLLMKSIWRWSQESRKDAVYDWWSSP
ncbi:14-3-3-like protein, related [Neospora caninum Liverpool]|uniref:14-3-3-like protein, related n=1 Tax=Neospora caninum (strain Liverpool) TaxID=572307 RepID=F0VLI4_NEOCL|nr:14-3-3-like protein, related [Neospora caninum Liverpool]CBZ54112.1 14-3-3-like protein, related [Neospora caninum Liverpool]CEL68811.1 TPA: 14-3-3-like protein, related [Neospora caninum Liverpool]|eukprot:XP_003884143.1 14-3-3-like protein, related [Neospora caninum Liverpool]